MNKNAITLRQSSALTLTKTNNLISLTKKLLSAKNALARPINNDNWCEELWSWADANSIDESTIPRTVDSLVQLSKLELFSNQLRTEPPESLGNLIQLTDLYLAGNRLVELPKSLGNLTLLTKFRSQGNDLVELPEWLDNLTQLTELSWWGDRLTELPEWLGNLTQLT
ncbi:hypothetical protein, partial [Moritella dasanensis]|uniref:leucine-rich repeat domain-containing protein n=1 Tax=Moritella dasanensis TaxID=428031 RepID=UPI0004749F89